MHVIEVAADSEIVNAGHRHRRKVEVVAQLDAALTEFLRGAGAAEAAATFEVETDEVRTEDRLIPTVLLEAERRFVQCAAVVPLMVKRSLVNPVLDLMRGLIGRSAAEVAGVLLVTIAAGDVDELIRQRLPADLSERELLLEGAGEDAGGSDRCGRRRKVRAGRRVLVDTLIGCEVVQLVLDDRAADVEARLRAVVIVVCGQRRVLKALCQRFDPGLRLIEHEGLSAKLIAT